LIQLIQLNRENTPEIAAIHCKAFPGFFLTDLGIDVLDVFYEALILDKSTLVWGVKDDQELIGFFVASSAPNGLYKRIFKQRFFSFFLPISVSFLKNINLLKRMIVSISSSSSIIVPNAYSVSLLSICVSPSHSSKGIGRMLLGKLESLLKLQQEKGYYLTTDTDNNVATNKFYLSNGFQLLDVYLQGNRRMNIYIKDLK
jgi:ribosomal protein S18 acetylase RimI-like enzyme